MDESEERGESPALANTFLARQLSDAYRGGELSRILAGLSAADRRPVTLRANTLIATGDEVGAELSEHGIRWEAVPWYRDAFVLPESDKHEVQGLPIYENGGVYLQSLSSMLPPLALAPMPGADVLDMCAAPGGKTSQIAALTKGTARICACELHAPRAARLEHNLAKLKVSGVTLMRCDARRLDPLFSFDQILLDAPCTGSGTVAAGDSRGLARITPMLLAKVSRAQAALLDRALTVLKTGGTLIYSTCSVLPAENEDQIRRAIQRHRDCKLVPLDDFISTGQPKSAMGIPELSVGLAGTLTVCPTETYEGFYLAKIKKGSAQQK
ncbi:Fmu (Sun) domain protein [Coriobacterium glomerans PW2]|uniref:Fmu (Sun) domain protein n=1 Tax=Coriobacterium glomerans (strain ATCC 49209 / DSM 20642 / JCM 10262 / PW2) TaxID=700015 RepID=F2NBN6_CORGP|nr:RsmB/NOP family class I SAM-dependent RNA methyltransferase [Coriobacterium glomerans]AEB06845.1 Fmu (Sun) domain protein [Coriobacterium glomerans PW2]